MREYAYHTQLSNKTRVLNGFRLLFRSTPLERPLQRLASGTSAHSFWGRLVPPEYLYEKGSWRQVERNGLSYKLDISNNTDHWAYFNFSDPGDQELHGLIKPHHVIVDIGANIGIRAMDFAQSVPQGRVIAFEPDPMTFKRLQEHLALNDLKHVSALNMGIGSEVGTEHLYRVVDSNSGMNRIVKKGLDMSDFASSEVQLSPLQPVLEGLDIAAVDVIKVDTEGFEFEVLKGCRTVIERDHPILFIELDDDNLKENDSSAAELVQWLKERGYAVVNAADRNPLPPDLGHCHIDILCSYPATGGA